jgi:uridylate kinase
VDGVYDKDPAIHADASRFSQVSYLEVLQRDLKVMDSTAISLCRDNGLPIMVFDFTKPGNILRAICGEDIGTKVGG